VHLQMCEGEEKGGNTCALTHLASPRLAGPGGAWRGVVARAHDVRVNSPPKSGPKPHRLACLIRFDRDRPSRLWDVVTLGRSSLYIYVWPPRK
jgi:hypothetical protein